MNPYWISRQVCYLAMLGVLWSAGVSWWVYFAIIGLAAAASVLAHREPHR